MLLAGLAPDSRAHGDPGAVRGEWAMAPSASEARPHSPGPVNLLSGHSQPPSGNPPAR